MVCQVYNCPSEPISVFKLERAGTSLVLQKLKEVEAERDKLAAEKVIERLRLKKMGDTTGVADAVKTWSHTC